MSVKWEKQEANKGTLTITVPAKEFEAELDRVFKEVRKDIEVPGFRKGKVPRVIFNQRFGEGSLYNDAINNLIPTAYEKAIDEAGIFPVAQPEIDFEQIEKGKDFVFTAEVVVKPEVELGDYKGLEVERMSTEVTEEDVDARIKEQQEKLVEMVVKEEGEVVEGDTVKIDFEGFVDGEAFEGGKAEGFDLEIGSGAFIPGFEEQLVGLKAGEEKDVVVTFPEDYHAKELEGKEATFKVTVHEIKEKVYPELNDDLANEIDPAVNTVAELKEKTKETLENEKTQAADNAVRDIVVKKAADNATIEIPEEMIDQEIDRMVQNFEQSLQMQGMNLEIYFQFTGQNEEALRESMKAEAEATVRSSLTLEAIAEAEELVPTEEDVNAELEQLAGQFGMEVEQIKEVIGGTEMIENNLKIQKTMDWLVEQANVTQLDA